ncbi:sm-like protein LSM1B [Lathyrus oleraceus]|uniref:sm-like protein LSM1B n=1 Tax=Pisum sativum TaxID=3888 RepID=UPI0021D0FF2F|nr:sm-like protein LSM1B [Pisum sativum]
MINSWFLLPLPQKLLILLRDGRKLMGTLRSFDQFANAVLEGACERVIVAFENPQDIIVQSARPYGQRVVLKFEFMLFLEGTLLEPSPTSFKLPSGSPVFSSSPIQNSCDNRSYKIITKQ